MHRLTLPILLVVALTGGVLASVERGNRLYRAGQYAEAVAVYQSVLEAGEDSPVLRYNLGTALLQLGRYDEAEEHLRAALEVVEPETREWVFYNLGQRFLEDARSSRDPEAAATLYDAAVESYRQALRLQPGDEAAKWNYELALREREEQQQSGGGGEQEPEDQSQEPRSGDPGQGGSTGGESPSDPTSAGDQGAQAPMSQEQAERILSAVEQDERELFRDKLRRGQQQTRTSRDW